MDPNVNPPVAKYEEGFAAECPKCSFKSSNLAQCSKCKCIFPPNVKKVYDSYYGDGVGAFIKLEPLDQLDPHSKLKLKYDPGAIIDEAENSESEEDNYRDSPKSQTSTATTEMTYEVGEDPERHKLLDDGVNYFTNVRCIHTTPRSIALTVSENRTKSDNVLFDGPTNAEEKITVIQEFGLSNKILKIRLLQMTPIGYKVVLRDSTYPLFLKEVLISCPCTSTFIREMLSMAQNLTKVIFGQYAFNLCAYDHDQETPSINSQIFKVNKLSELSLTYDRYRYADYDFQDKEVVREKIKFVLQLASTSFSNLQKCDLLIPDEIEAELDFLLSSKPDIRHKGVKHTLDDSISFEIGKQSTKTNTKSSEIDIIDLLDSSDEDQVPVTQPSPVQPVHVQPKQVLIPSIVPSVPKIKPRSKVSTTANTAPILQNAELEELPLEWNGGDADFTNQEVSTYIYGMRNPCKKCGTVSKNLVKCSKCNYIFPPNTKPIKFDELEPSETSRDKPTSSQETTYHRHGSLERNSSRSREESSTRPRFVDGKLAQCLNCGGFYSKDFYKCDRCSVEIPPNPKTIFDPDYPRRSKSSRPSSSRRRDSSSRRERSRSPHGSGFSDRVHSPPRPGYN